MISAALCFNSLLLFFHSGQLKKAEKAALEAKEILLVFQGPLGSDYVEASRLINCMSSTT